MLNSQIDESDLRAQSQELIEILEIMPDDIATLNSIVYNLLLLEDYPKAVDFAIRLRQVLIADDNEAEFNHYVKQYMEFAPACTQLEELCITNDTDSFNPAPQTQKKVLLKKTTPTPEIILPVEPLSNDAPFAQTSSIIELEELSSQLNSELKFADLMKMEQVITSDQCDRATESMIANSTNPNITTPLSFLYEVSLLQHINMDKLLGIITHEYNIPFINLADFKLQPETVDLIPRKLSKKLGIIIFDQFCGELQVAILNPLNKELKRAISRFLNKKAHFFLASPSELQRTYEKLG